MKRFLFLAGTIWLLILSPACNDKDNNIKYYNFQRVTEDFMFAFLIQSEANFMVDAVLKTLEDSLAANPSGTYQWGSAQVTVTPADVSTYPKSFTLDYGTRTLDSLSGKITGQMTDKYFESGCVVSYTFLDYIVDSNSVQGFDTIRIEGPGPSLNSFKYSIAMNDVLIIRTRPDDHKDTTSFEAIEHAQLVGLANQVVIPEAYMSGLSSDSMRFSVSVHADYSLIKDADCHFLSDGIFDYYIKDFYNSSIGEGAIDFGYPVPGACDKYAGISINGDGYTVDMQFVMD
ncbi:MAG: hypothetical protein NT175_03725 [Bacteroidetes bacterium]|nr:hypothetical protein [Bacteroidota bacterium]